MAHRRCIPRWLSGLEEDLAAPADYAEQPVGCSIPELESVPPFRPWSDIPSGGVRIRCLKQ